MSRKRKDGQVIVNWQPSRLDVDTITNELTAMLGQRLILISLPGIFTPPMPTGSIGWHQDNRGQDMEMIMWSNVYPTEVRFSDGKKLTSKDGDVLFIKNARVHHRMPPAANRVHNRWFVRAVVTKRFEKHSTRT